MYIYAMLYPYTSPGNEKREREGHSFQTSRLIDERGLYIDATNFAFFSQYYYVISLASSMPRPPPAATTASLPILPKAALPTEQLTQIQRRLAHLLNSLAELQGHVSTAQTLEEW